MKYFTQKNFMKFYITTYQFLIRLQNLYLETKSSRSWQHVVAMLGA